MLPAAALTPRLAHCLSITFTAIDQRVSSLTTRPLRSFDTTDKGWAGLDPLRASSRPLASRKWPLQRLYTLPPGAVGLGCGPAQTLNQRDAVPPVQSSCTHSYLLHPRRLSPSARQPALLSTLGNGGRRGGCRLASTARVHAARPFCIDGRSRCGAPLRLLLSANRGCR